MDTNTHLIKTGKIHELRIRPKFVDDLVYDRKSFEVRSTKDREFNSGDMLFLNEYNPEERVYTGRQLRVMVTGVYTGIGVAPGFAILSLANLERTGNQWIVESERVGRAEDSLTNHITQADLDAVAPLFPQAPWLRRPGGEGSGDHERTSIRITPPPFPDLHNAVNKMRGVDRVQELASRMVLDEAKLHDSVTIECLRNYGYVVLKTEEEEALRKVARDAMDFQGAHRSLIQTHDSYGAFEADNRLESSIKHLIAVSPTKGKP